MGHWRNQRGYQEIPSNKLKWKHSVPKSLGLSKGSSKGEFDSNTGLPQETRKISNKQSNLTLRRMRKRRINKSRVSRRKEIVKLQVELNETETKKPHKNLRAGSLKR